jgi:hypothetical protein
MLQMKKLLILLFLAFIVKANAQTNLFTQLKNKLKIEHPEINLDNKLIALNVWSAADQNSREANKQFKKAYSVYEYAKLKGGSKGIVCLSINKTDENAQIILVNDGVTKLIPIKLDNENDLNELNNIVYNSDGVIVYKNMLNENIFNLIHKLITR